MNGPDSAGSSGPFELTLDGSSRSADSSLPRSEAGNRRCMHLQMDSEGGLSCETRDLLRYRLRWASLILMSGFAAFLVWELIRVGIGETSWKWTLLIQGGLTIVLGVCGTSLCHRRAFSKSWLRVKELMVFGLPACYLLFAQSRMLAECARNDGFLPSPVVPWLILMFTYALFIPNTWQRAAAIIGAMAVAPLLLVGALWMTDQVCAELIATQGRFPVDVTLQTGIVFGACVAGVYTINTLRVEAFEARQLGQYRLGEKLGSGGMGEVYKAEHQLMKRPCAIKIIRPEKAGDRRVLARFEREVRMTAKLSHWNNIDIYDYGRADDGTFYYVMEFLPGMNLQELVTRYGPLSPERTVFLIRQTCDALTEAHQHGLIHRDIKPANIFAAERGGHFDVAKLLDFGLAKPLARFGDGPVPTSDVQLTQEGTLTGSPLYMSPEQALGDREPDERSDIYSLGLVLYYLLTGQTPFQESNPVRLLVAHAHQNPRPISELRDGVSDDLEAVVMRCLSKAPEDRFESAAELAAALDDCRSDDVWDCRRAAQWWKQQRHVRREAPQPVS